jgi:hypothetical protein
MASLDQRKVTRYAKYAALRTALEKWLEENREPILKALRGGAKSPDGGPYLLELSAIPAQPNWKEEFRRDLKENRGYTDKWIDERFAKILKAKRPLQFRVLCKTNPAHRGKVTVNLPLI